MSHIIFLENFALKIGVKLKIKFRKKFWGNEASVSESENFGGHESGTELESLLGTGNEIGVGLVLLDSLSLEKKTPVIIQSYLNA